MSATDPRADSPASDSHPPVATLDILRMRALGGADVGRELARSGYAAACPRLSCQSLKALVLAPKNRMTGSNAHRYRRCGQLAPHATTAMSTERFPYAGYPMTMLTVELSLHAGLFFIGDFFIFDHLPADTSTR